MSTEDLDEIRSILSKLKRSERASAYVQMNCWEWPKVLEKFKPDEFDNLCRWSQVQGCKEFEAVWKIVWDASSSFEQSRQWWKDKDLEKIHADGLVHKDWFRKTFRKVKATESGSDETRIFTTLYQEDGIRPVQELQAEAHAE